MPQMAPMNWMNISMIFILIMMLSTMIFYFYIFNNNTISSPSSYKKPMKLMKW
uniref:ATP synthase F0 subunit 8 n=1 Tax=Stylochyrus rarior TaxID=679428 RepID=D0UY33_STYRA|nr:ATP synthase F0 subunit 8 [Stylochyrus rarior]ACY35977.1 ATP synthase F0 subunit 8 [Stylochyrus rarior]